MALPGMKSCGGRKMGTRIMLKRLSDERNGSLSRAKIVCKAKSNFGRLWAANRWPLFRFIVATDQRNLLRI